MPNSAYTIIFSAIVGILCASVLAGWGSFTRSYREANRKAERVRNIMRVLGVSYPEKASARELLDVFNEKLEEREADGLTYYAYTGAEDGTPIAVPFRGSGVWGPIKAVLALESDQRTIRGIAFYEQEETPGLGAKIATTGFTSKFKGKRIAPDNGRPGEAGMTITPPNQAGGPREVDGISGATMTSDRVEKMLNDIIENIVAKVNGNV